MRPGGRVLIRDDVTFLDVEFLLEFLAGIKLGDAARTAELRQRHLAVIIDGLLSAQGAATGQRAPIPRPAAHMGRADRALACPLGAKEGVACGPS